MKKRAYRSVSVKDVEIQEVLKQLSAGAVWVGVDIAKADFQAVIRDAEGKVERPWKVRQPSEIQEFVARLARIAEKHPLVVAMESTGTYGDALRQALTDRGLAVHRVSAKAVCDYAEIYDGVPSQHDGKDAAVVAELTAQGKSRAWPCRDASVDDAELRGEVLWLDTQQGIRQLWRGRLEALLARHWPEVGDLAELDSATLLQVLREYGGPQAFGQDPAARRNIAKWGRALAPGKAQALLESARTTVGVRMNAGSQETMKRYAEQAWQARQNVRAAQAKLAERASVHPVLRRMGVAVGESTACVLWVTVGDPREFSCGAAYRKALGLNLKERSSGQHQGQLKITKRGPSLARRWLYFAALRAIQHQPVETWYKKKKQKDQERGGRGVVAVMRKLALAVYAVAKGPEEFDREQLFPGRSRTKKRSPGGVDSQGALPPDPRDLSPSCQARSAEEEAPTTTGAPTSTLASGTALESVPTGALSSAQLK